MSVHWTDFPERVEKFGDLFNIFETLAHDLRADLIHSGSCEKESDASAYEVGFLRHGDELFRGPTAFPAGTDSPPAPNGSSSARYRSKSCGRSAGGSPRFGTFPAPLSTS